MAPRQKIAGTSVGATSKRCARIGPDMPLLWSYYGFGTNRYKDRAPTEQGLSPANRTQSYRALRDGFGFRANTRQ
jgi:hypothetical protein